MKITRLVTAFMAAGIFFSGIIAHADECDVKACKNRFKEQNKNVLHITMEISSPADERLANDYLAIRGDCPCLFDPEQTKFNYVGANSRVKLPDHTDYVQIYGDNEKSIKEQLAIYKSKQSRKAAAAQRASDNAATTAVPAGRSFDGEYKWIYLLSQDELAHKNPPACTKSGSAQWNQYQVSSADTLLKNPKCKGQSINDKTGVLIIQCKGMGISTLSHVFGGPSMPGSNTPIGLYNFFKTKAACGKQPHG